jgi:hypothetical protein
VTRTESLSPAHSRLWDQAIQILENNKGGYSEDVEPLPAPPEAILEWSRPTAIPRTSRTRRIEVQTEVRRIVESPE